MKKTRNRPINQRVKTREERIKIMYLELKAQDLKPSKIIDRIADRFCVSDKTVYRDLQLKKSNLTPAAIC
jgi:DeoR/GlpR family transcriptional regulator of sugar metabolism